MEVVVEAKVVAVEAVGPIISNGGVMGATAPITSSVTAPVDYPTRLPSTGRKKSAPYPQPPPQQYQPPFQYTAPAPAPVTSYAYAAPTYTAAPVRYAATIQYAQPRVQYAQFPNPATSYAPQPDYGAAPKTRMQPHSRTRKPPPSSIIFWGCNPLAVLGVKQ